MSRSALQFVVAAGLTAALAPSVDGQLWPDVPKPATVWWTQDTTDQRGWIGVQVDLRTTVDARSRRTVAIVEGVSRDGPAYRAGLRRGDVLLAMNGVDAQEHFAQAAARIRPGDPVRITLMRDGRRSDLSLVAGSRPIARAEVTSGVFRIEVDSVAESMFRAMDSLRVHLEGRGQLHVVASRGSDGATTVVRRVRGRDGQDGDTENLVIRLGSPFGGQQGTVVDVETHGEVRPPFGFFLFSGEQHDSLKLEMERLNRELRSVRAREERLVRAASGAGAVTARAQDELGVLARSRAMLRERTVALKRSMEGAAVEAVRAASDRPVDHDAVVAARFTPLAPYALGQNRAAGAEIVDLRPEMADYFQVERGALVVDVPTGTPAARAGIVPGDVIVRVGGRVVTSVADFRRNLSLAGLPANIALVRKGRSVEVLIR